MINLAGAEHQICDETISAELKAAQIPIISVFRSSWEVPATEIGLLGDWVFTRAWYYWSAHSPTGIPFEVVERLYTKIGKEVRLDGHCEPEDWWKHISPRRQPAHVYHIDTLGGLEAFSELLRSLGAEGPKSVMPKEKT